MTTNPIISQLAAISQASAKAGFEVQFNNLQNSLIRRFNDEVDDLNGSSKNGHRIEALQKEASGLLDTLPVLEQYRIGNQNNFSQLEVLLTDLTTLRDNISADDNVTADEVSDFVALRDRIADRAGDLFIFVHPDINDANATQRLKDAVPDFRALTPVVGTYSGDNAALSDSLDTFINEVTVTSTVTSNTIATTFDLESKVQTEFSDVDAELLKLTVEELNERNNRVDDLRVDLGNTLRAISLSFEINSVLATQLNDSLREKVPEKGSVLNFFT